MKELNDLYKERKLLLTKGFSLDSYRIEQIERQIEDIENLPSFEDIIQMIICGKMKSIF